jgi:hypothetical protein
MVDKNVWRGVLIAEGLKNQAVLEYIHIIKTDFERLESEEGLGEFHFHKIEVDDILVDKVVEIATRDLKEGWYFHLVKDNKMKVMFTGKCLEVTKGNEAQFDNVKKYGLSLGIHEDQIQLERLIDNPYDE